MNDAKHFNYEANIVLDNNKSGTVVVQEVVFLTPAKLIVLKNEIPETMMVSVDIINRKVYDSDGNTFLSDAVFAHLDGINILSEDFFAAPDQILEEASKADSDRERMLREAKTDLEQSSDEKGDDNG